MHTVIVLSGGFALLAVCLLLGHAWGNGMPGVLAGARAFVPLWLVAAFFNMWVGTTHGHSWTAELPIFLVVFAVPASVAALLWWRLG